MTVNGHRIKGLGTVRCTGSPQTSAILANGPKINRMVLEHIFGSINQVKVSNSSRIGMLDIGKTDNDMDKVLFTTQMEVNMREIGSRTRNMDKVCSPSKMEPSTKAALNTIE